MKGQQIMKTMTLLEKELKSIRADRMKGKYESGLFGFKACKESIKWDMEYHNLTIQQVYGECVKRALTEIGFNTFMIVACEEMMNE